MPWVTTTINQIFNSYFRNTAFTPVTPVFLGLFKVTPGLDGLGGTEVTSSDLNPYARQPATFSVASGRAISNSVACLFAASAAVPSGAFTVVSGGIFSASTGGTLYAYGLLTSPLAVGVGSLVNIPINQLTITDPGT